MLIKKQYTRLPQRLKKQAVVTLGEIQIRQILHLTVNVDHDVIDGVPAAKFVDDLVVKLEKGFGL